MSGRQAEWQKQFLQEYQIAPFRSDSVALKNIRYTRLDNPATWWHNPLNKNSLRLTYQAFYMLKKAGCKFTEFVVTDKLKPKTFVQLERHFTGPYYLLNSQKIAMHGDVDAMMLALHANNLQQYLDNQDK
jgi:hypothetical protein